MAFTAGHKFSPIDRKYRYVQDAIVKALAQNPEKLKKAVMTQLDRAANDGDLAALDWLTTRLEGKPMANVGDADAPQERFSSIRMVLYVPPALMPSNEVIEAVEVVPEVLPARVVSDV